MDEPSEPRSAAISAPDPALAFLQSFSAASEYAPRFTVPSDPGITKPFWRRSFSAVRWPILPLLITMDGWPCSTS